MAVVDIELSSLSMEELPEAIKQVSNAAIERWTILKAFGMTSTQSLQKQFLDSLWFPEYYCPTYASRLNILNTLVFNMSEKFVDLSADYIKHGMSNFPKPLRRAVQEDSNSLGVNSIAVGESFAPESMERYKNLLKNACDWLNRMTCIKPPNSFCSTTQYWNDSKSWQEAPGYEHDLSNKTAPLELQSTNERFNSYAYFQYSRTSRETYSNETIIDKSGTRGIEARTGLTIDNRSPYRAETKLFLTIPTVEESSRNYWENNSKFERFQREVLICRNPWQPNPDTDPDEYWPGANHSTIEMLVKTGDGLKDAYLGDSDITFTAGNPEGTNHCLSAQEDTYTRNWTPDGTQSYLKDEQHETHGESSTPYWYAPPENSLNITFCYLWDGFGSWLSAGEPISGNSCPAHTKAYAWDPLPVLTEPDIDFQSFNGSVYSRGDYDWSEIYNLHYDVVVVPVLDFTDSITTFNVA